MMEEAGVLEYRAGKRKKRRKGSFEKDAVSGRGIHLCSVYPYLNQAQNRKGSSAYQGKPSVCSIFVPPNRLWNIILVGVCCISFHKTACAAILCHFEWGGGQMVKQWESLRQHRWRYLDMWFNTSKEMTAMACALNSRPYYHLPGGEEVSVASSYTAAGACGALGTGWQVVGGRAFKEDPATHIRVQGTAKVH